jgi:hypothetical protein
MGIFTESDRCGRKTPSALGIPCPHRLLRGTGKCSRPSTGGKLWVYVKRLGVYVKRFDHRYRFAYPAGQSGTNPEPHRQYSHRVPTEKVPGTSLEPTQEEKPRWRKCEV